MSRADPLDPAGALILSQYDTPVATFRLLGWRTNLLVVIALLIVCAPAWFSTIVRAVSMKDMVMGLGQIGGRAPGDMSAGLFMFFWIGAAILFAVGALIVYLITSIFIRKEPEI